MSTMANTHLRCQECGCYCDSCHSNNSLHLHKEIEELKRQVLEREYHILQMETNVMADADKYPNGEFAALNDQMQLCQDKYERLLESHRKLQRVNQGLEDKLLKIVDKYETEKTALNRDLASLTSRLVEARVSLAQLEEENEQYRNDCNIATQLLQCKPSNFVAQRLDSFPPDFQHRAKLHLNTRKTESFKEQGSSSPEVRTIRVPIPTFPPTAMVYSVNNGEVGKGSSSAPPTPTTLTGQSNGSNDVVSAAIMAKVLEERAKERGTDNGCCSARRKSLSCTCKCKTSSRTSDNTKPYGLVSVTCQTQWSIAPDAVSRNRSYADANLQCSCLTTSAAAVHSQRWVIDSTSCPSNEIGGGRKWQRSGSSTSTETEI